MHVLRWPNSSLMATAPQDWDILLLYMMGPDAEALYMSDAPPMALHDIFGTVDVLHQGSSS